ncbi:thioesterase family protein-like protein [Microthyrium microscopicum]|uniref:Thioesterase family protein-like protein n=1 Tax=Microthyrium microscopicum TaxID=703497 RepID=A0A6A6UCG4_9PEZI|nr:thioesterase family protein-like protein [Microthyrium microscopicum]
MASNTKYSLTKDHMVERYFPMTPYFDEDLMKEVKLLDAGPEGTVLFELLMDSKYSNLNDVMHGGAFGVVFDMLTTTALGPLAKPDFYFFMGGVTRTLNISYLRAIPIGTTIRVRSWVVSAGRTMALIRSEMTSVDGKLVYATCEHHKVNVEAKKEHLAVRTPWDEEIQRPQDAKAGALNKRQEKL